MPKPSRWAIYWQLGWFGKAVAGTVVAGFMLIGTLVGLVFDRSSLGSSIGAGSGLLAIGGNLLFVARKVFDPARARAEGERMGREQRKDQHP